MLSPRPLSLYVHLPWCVRKCPYCDFNSHEAESFPEADYVARLLSDMEGEQKNGQSRQLASVFFGGGTPSLFQPESIAKILERAQQLFDFAPAVEITLEANPGTAEAARFDGYKNAGVSRLSIGVQTFSDAELQALGRIHSSQQALDAVAMARSAGFDNINLDLMHGLPGQNVAGAVDDLEKALALGPEHISWYQLTIEPNTHFYSSPPQLPIEDCLAGIQERGQALLEGAGYRHYEVSAYARDDHQSRHNLNYWSFGDYLGIGAGAHSKTTEISSGTVFRHWKLKQPSAYLDPGRDPVAGSRALLEDERLEEFLINALRLSQGFMLADFETATGLPRALLLKRAKEMLERGLLHTDKVRFGTTALGWRFLDSVLAGLLQDQNS